MALLKKEIPIKVGFHSLLSVIFSLCAASVAQAGEGDAVDRARLTVGGPAYVYHPDGRTGGRDWNDSWFHNEGVLVDVSWPVAELSHNTRLRVGGIAGGFDNSIFHTSIFAGGMGEIETQATERLTLGIGLYAGAITGYDHAEVSPAIAPYAGGSYAVTEQLELGLRGFWLPARTLAGADLAASDAYIGAVTLGVRF